MAQETSKVTGTVSDESGEPIPGANVVVKGTTTGSVTDLNGKFAISAASGGVLRFSFTGYVAQEVTLNGQSSVDIVLVEDIEQLADVIVDRIWYSEKVSPDRIHIQGD